MSAVSGLLALKDASTNEWVGEFQQTIFVRNSRGYNVGTTQFGLMAGLDNEPVDTVEYNWANEGSGFPFQASLTRQGVFPVVIRGLKPPGYHRITANAVPNPSPLRRAKPQPLSGKQALN